MSTTNLSEHIVACARPSTTTSLAKSTYAFQSSEDGEILARGELIMNGYWNDPESTNKTIIDGWVHTGDIGEFDEEDYLKITDRKKDIIVNAGGDNISPSRIEAKLDIEPEIAQSMLYGDFKNYLVFSLNRFERKNLAKTI